MAEFIEYGRDSLLPYRKLLQSFVADHTTADELEHQFLALYKHDATNWPDAVFKILDSFFFDVDDYVADASLRAQVKGIDAAQLRAKAELTLQRLADAAPEA